MFCFVHLIGLLERSKRGGGRCGHGLGLFGCFDPQRPVPGVRFLPRGVAQRVPGTRGPLDQVGDVLVRPLLSDHFGPCGGGTQVKKIGGQLGFRDGVEGRDQGGGHFRGGGGGGGGHL